MDLNYLKKVIRIFDDSNMAEMTIEEEGIKIKLAKNRENKSQQIIFPSQNFTPANNVESNQANSVISSNNIVADNTKTNRESEPGQHETKSSLHTIYSPIVGTFYKAPSPDSEPYVEIGTHVSAGNTLCIIEAMKLMNEIESDISGTVVKILIENAQAVEFNQPLFIIKPD